ncbi:MAG: sodium:calcium exchanger [Gammaproteobacteria bacterium]|nr:MAG: sodium:calcium exchanger [Gammaproteobacteria bacterium]
MRSIIPFIHVNEILYTNKNSVHINYYTELTLTMDSTMKKIFPSLLTVLFSLSSSYALAHSEHDKARFVSPQGKNIGKCDNVLRPCSSIAYAVQQANKGDKVLVSAGKYPIKTSEELFYLKSEIVPVLGGYNRFDHFQSQSPDSNITTLLGVPSEMAKSLRLQGFAVISDGKSLGFSKDFQQRMQAYSTLNEKQSDLSCVNNLAGSFACNNIDLLAHIPLADFSSKPSAGNDIWGHVDLNTGDEYALIGLNNGVAVVNVSDPTNPVEVGTIRGKSDIWRDIKVYQYFDASLNLWRAYAFATIDGSSDYVTVIDLNHLPNSISLVEKNTAVAQAHNVYITNVDHSLNIALAGMTPTLQLIGARQTNGASKFGGAFHSYSLNDPENIVLLSNNSAGDGYTHDGASVLITDDRKSNNCQETGDSCTVFIDFNEKEMKLWNISDASNTKLLGIGEYNDVDKSKQYVHSGWASEDKQYVFLHDEFDEYKGGLNSTVRVFSIADLTNPQKVGQWTGPTRAIDHNGFVRGNRYYMSNYERGLTVLDISDPTNPSEVGFFDTFTPADSASFNGAWGTYPFLPSGNILVSDINSGLYILKDNTLTSTQGQISFSAKQVSTAQGEQLQINVERNNASNTATSVSVGYEVIPGSAKENEDYTPVSGTLTWDANNTSAKQISVNIAADTTGNEFQEDFYVRLFNPTNGSNILSPTYLTVNIDGKVDNGAVSFVKSNVQFAENKENITIKISRDGNRNGEISANYHLESGSAIIGQDVADTSGTLIWQDGEFDTKTIAIALVNDSEEETDETFTIVLEASSGSSLGANSTINVTIADDDANTAPLVNVTENFQANTGQTVNLTATVSDKENDALTYIWTQKSGTIVTINNADTLNASFVAPSLAGDLTFSLTSTDSKGLQNTDSIIVSIIKAPVTVVPDTKKSSGGSQSILLILLMPLIMLKRKK